MPLEYEIRDGALSWIKSPVTGAISYVVDVRGKSFAFTLGAHEHSSSHAPALGDEAIRHAISRALVMFDETLKPLLRSGNYLTRDSRMKERKKYGRKGARRRFQFSKR